MREREQKHARETRKPRKRCRPRGSTSVDLCNTTKQELRAIIRQASGSPTGVPMTRAVSSMIRKFRRLQELADASGFLRIHNQDSANTLTLDLNLE